MNEDYPAAEQRNRDGHKPEIDEAAESVSKTNTSVVNKRIDFDKKTMKRLNLMLPLYKDEIGGGARDSELYSYIVGLAVNKLFESDFKKRLEEL